MKEEKNRKASYSLCVITGMLCGIIYSLPSLIKILMTVKKQIDKLWWSRYNKSDFFFFVKV